MSDLEDKSSALVCSNSWSVDLPAACQREVRVNIDRLYTFTSVCCTSYGSRDSARAVWDAQGRQGQFARLVVLDSRCRSHDCLG